MEEVHLSSSRAVKLDGGEAARKGVELGFGGEEVWRMDGEKLAAVWDVTRSLNDQG